MINTNCYCFFLLKMTDDELSTIDEKGLNESIASQRAECDAKDDCKTEYIFNDDNIEAQLNFFDAKVNGLIAVFKKYVGAYPVLTAKQPEKIPITKDDMKQMIYKQKDEISNGKGILFVNHLYDYIGKLDSVDAVANLSKLVFVEDEKGGYGIKHESITLNSNEEATYIDTTNGGLGFLLLLDIKIEENEKYYKKQYEANYEQKTELCGNGPNSLNDTIRNVLQDEINARTKKYTLCKRFIQGCINYNVAIEKYFDAKNNNNYITDKDVTAALTEIVNSATQLGILNNVLGIDKAMKEDKDISLLTIENIENTEISRLDQLLNTINNNEDLESINDVMNEYSNIYNKSLNNEDYSEYENKYNTAFNTSADAMGYDLVKKDKNGKNTNVLKSMSEQVSGTNKEMFSYEYRKLPRYSKARREAASDLLAQNKQQYNQMTSAKGINENYKNDFKTTTDSTKSDLTLYKNKYENAQKEEPKWKNKVNDKYADIEKSYNDYYLAVQQHTKFNQLSLRYRAYETLLKYTKSYWLSLKSCGADGIKTVKEEATKAIITRFESCKETMPSRYEDITEYKNYISKPYEEIQLFANKDDSTFSDESLYSDKYYLNNCENYIKAIDKYIQSKRENGTFNIVEIYESTTKGYLEDIRNHIDYGYDVKQGEKYEHIPSDKEIIGTFNVSKTTTNNQNKMATDKEDDKPIETLKDKMDEYKKICNNMEIINKVNDKMEQYRNNIKKELNDLKSDYTDNMKRASDASLGMFAAGGAMGVTFVVAMLTAKIAETQVAAASASAFLPWGLAILLAALALLAALIAAQVFTTKAEKNNENFEKVKARYNEEVKYQIGVRKNINSIFSKENEKKYGYWIGKSTDETPKNNPTIIGSYLNLTRSMKDSYVNGKSYFTKYADITEDEYKNQGLEDATITTSIQYYTETFDNNSSSYLGYEAYYRLKKAELIKFIKSIYTEHIQKTNDAVKLFLAYQFSFIQGNARAICNLIRLIGVIETFMEKFVDKVNKGLEQLSTIKDKLIEEQKKIDAINSSILVCKKAYAAVMNGYKPTYEDLIVAENKYKVLEKQYNIALQNYNQAKENYNFSVKRIEYIKSKIDELNFELQDKMDENYKRLTAEHKRLEENFNLETNKEKKEKIKAELDKVDEELRPIMNEINTLRNTIKAYEEDQKKEENNLKQYAQTLEERKADLESSYSEMKSAYEDYQLKKVAYYMSTDEISAKIKDLENEKSEHYSISNLYETAFNSVSSTVDSTIQENGHGVARATNTDDIESARAELNSYLNSAKLSKMFSYIVLIISILGIFYVVVRMIVKYNKNCEKIKQIEEDKDKNNIEQGYNIFDEDNIDGSGCSIKAYLGSIISIIIIASIGGPSFYLLRYTNYNRLMKKAENVYIPMQEYA